MLSEPQNNLDGSCGCHLEGGGSGKLQLFCESRVTYMSVERSPVSPIGLFGCRRALRCCHCVATSVYIPYVYSCQEVGYLPPRLSLVHSHLAFLPKSGRVNIAHTMPGGGLLIPGAVKWQ